jgi:hypothetical protein
MILLVPYWVVKLIGSLADTAWAHVAIYACVLAALAVIAVAAREAREQRIAHEASGATTLEDSPGGSPEVKSRSDSVRIQARWMNLAGLFPASGLTLHGVSVWTNRIAFDVVASAALLGMSVCVTMVVKVNRRIIG